MLEVASVCVYGVLFASLLLRISESTHDSHDLLICTLAILPGYLFADFAAGVVHWFCDTFFEENTPVLGSLLIQPFREHHRDPQAMTRHRFFELNGNNCLAMIPLLFFVWWTEGRIGSHWSLFAHSLLLTFTLAIFATNQFHRWAHQQKSPVMVAWLQRSGLILQPERHQRHHSDYKQGFCVTSGWMNTVLDAILSLRVGFGNFER